MGFAAIPGDAFRKARGNYRVGDERRKLILTFD
jgi:hypothetical protein